MERFLIALTLLAVPSAAQCEEAVYRTGRRQAGQLVQDQPGWSFRNVAGSAVELSKLSYIAFKPAPTHHLTGPLAKRIVLPGGQHLAGALAKVDDQSVTFVTALGKPMTLLREKVASVLHADDWLPIVHEDFETPLSGWKTPGAASLVEAAFHGKQCLRLDASDQAMSREWPELTRGRITLALGRSKKGSPRCTIELISSRAVPSLVLDEQGMRFVGARDQFGSIDIAGAWHLLSVEWNDGMLRAYINDHCLGQTPMPAKAGVAGIRFTTKVASKDSALFIDELTVSRRLPSIALPQAHHKLDHVWLEQGEQLFGRLVSADTRAVVLDAKFGKRTLPWSRLRGIGFAESKPAMVPGNTEIEFRPGPGSSADRLHVKLIRWEAGKLIVQHAALGELAIERERLEKIRFEAK